MVPLGLFLGGLVLLFFLLRSLCWKKISELSLTAELSKVGVSRGENEKIKGTAVICGGSIAGLLTARVCHDHFDRVLVIEREAWLNTEDARVAQAWTQQHRRVNVIQYYSANIILALSREILDRLFSDFRQQCNASNTPIRPGNYHFTAFGRDVNLPDDVPETVFASRQGYETLLRRLILDKKRYPNIEQITGTVTGINPDDTSSSRVRSVSIRKEDGATVSIEGRFFIDCTGSAQALNWLDKAGYGRLDQTDSEVLPLRELKISYDPRHRTSTMEFPVSSDLITRMNLPDDDRIFIYSTIAHPWKSDRTVLINKRDGGMIQLGAASWGGHVPSDLESFIQFSESMYREKPFPDYYYRCLDLLHEVEDKMKCSKVSVPPRVYIRYHMAARLPDNWVAIGDSVMTLNPALGQGCTKAAIGAICFNALLHDSKFQTALPQNLSRRFFHLLHQKTGSIWQVFPASLKSLTVHTGRDEAKMTDYGRKGTIPVPGESLSLGWFTRWYGYRLLYAASENSNVAQAFNRSAHILATSIELMHPRVVWKVIWDAISAPSSYFY